METEKNKEEIDIETLNPKTIVEGTYKFKDGTYHVDITPTGKEEKAKLKIKVKNTVIYRDTLNICSTRNRGKIKKELKEKPIPENEAEQLADKIYNTAINKIKFDKNKVLKKEKEQENKKKQEEQFNELTQEDKTEAENLLLDHNLLHKIRKTMDKHIVSENDTKLLLFLTMLSSRALNEPLHGQITGESSGGKSYTVNQVWKYLPEQENKIKLTRVTQGWMEYASEDLEWKNGLLYVAEGAGIDQAKEVVKMLTSGEKIHLGTTIEEKQGDKRKAVSIESGKHSPSFITTTAIPIEDSELKNRLITIGIDETKEQTQKILNYQANKHREPWNHTGVSEKEIQKIKYMTKELTKGTQYNVVIPYAQEIKKELPSTVTMRRNLKKIFGILKTITWIHQYQRQQFEKNGKWYVVAHPIDLFYTQQIFGDAFTKTEAELHQTAETIYKIIKKNQEKLPNKFTKNKLKEKTPIGTKYKDGTLRRFLKDLTDIGFFNSEKDPNDRRRNLYWISEKRQLDTLQSVTNTFNYSKHHKAYMKTLEKSVTENPENCWSHDKLKCPVSKKEVRCSNGDSEFSVTYPSNEEKDGNNETEDKDTLVTESNIPEDGNTDIPDSRKKIGKDNGGPTPEEIVEKFLEEKGEMKEEKLIESLKINSDLNKEDSKGTIKKMKKNGNLYTPKHGKIRLDKSTVNKT